MKYSTEFPTNVSYNVTENSESISNNIETIHVFTLIVFISSLGGKTPILITCRLRYLQLSVHTNC